MIPEDIIDGSRFCYVDDRDGLDGKDREQLKEYLRRFERQEEVPWELTWELSKEVFITGGPEHSHGRGNPRSCAHPS